MNHLPCPISKETNLQEFLSNFKQDINPENFVLSDETDDPGPDVKLLAKDSEFGIDVAENCSLDKLSCDTDRSWWDEIKILKPRQLNTLRQFKSYENFNSAFEKCAFSLQEFQKRWHRKQPVAQDFSYKNKKDLFYKSGGDPVTVLDDILLTVIVYKPLYNYDALDSPTANLMKKMKPLRQFDMLGHHSLKDLQSIIRCKNSESLMGEFSNHLEEWQKYTVTAGDCYKGSFFFIENTFYSSEEGDNFCYDIREWVYKDSERLEEFGFMMHRSMEEVKLIDLTICFGKPYLYQHLGDCEHMIVFSDAKLINKHNKQQLADYPVCTGASRFAILKCLLCETCNAEWLVSDCPILPLEKTQLCDYCIRMFLYDDQLRKIPEAGNFKVFRLPAFDDV